MKTAQDCRQALEARKAEWIAEFPPEVLPAVVEKISEEAYKVADKCGKELLLDLEDVGKLLQVCGTRRNQLQGALEAAGFHSVRFLGQRISLSWE